MSFSEFDFKPPPNALRGTGLTPLRKPAPIAWAMGEARAMYPTAMENAAAFVRTLNEIRALPEKEAT